MNLDLAFYWKLFCRRLPVMTVFLLGCATIGVITALKLPETWSAEARLLVEAPQIPDEMVAATVQTDAEEQLDIIQQKLMTRANLIDIANRFDVFADIRSMEPDSVVKAMREATSIRRSAGRNQATLMRISFKSRSGRIAANVVNEYVTLVLEENAQFRESRAENTLTFFEQEVERLGQDLDRQSTQIAIFKSDNVNALPEDQNYRLGRQALLQERLSRTERDQNAALLQRKEMLRLFQTTGAIGASTQVPQTAEQQQLVVAQAELDQALTLYSESHPRVIRLRARVERLEAVVTALVSSTTGGAGDAGTLSPQQAIMESTLAEIDARLQYLQSDADATRGELDELQDAISRSSANSIELASLERDYQNIQARYNAAVGNLNTAQMSDRREKTARGQRISVIENATIPQIPTGPNRPRIAIMGAAFGVMLAGAYFLLLELLIRSVRRPAELVGRFNVTPITIIPYMESRSERMLRRSGILAATLIVAIGVPLALWYVDTNYIPLELVVQRGLERLGLG